MNEPCRRTGAQAGEGWGASIELISHHNGARRTGTLPQDKGEERLYNSRGMEGFHQSWQQPGRSGKRVGAMRERWPIFSAPMKRECGWVTKKRPALLDLLHSAFLPWRLVPELHGNCHCATVPYHSMLIKGPSTNRYRPLLVGYDGNNSCESVSHRRHYSPLLIVICRHHLIYCLQTFSSIPSR